MCNLSLTLNSSAKSFELLQQGQRVVFHDSAVCACRAEPLLTRIKADRTVVVSPVFDRVNYYDLDIVHYVPAAHAFDWALWCMYESFRPEWYHLNDTSLPGK